MGGFFMKMDLLSQIRARVNRTEVYSKPDFWDAKAAHFDGTSISMWANPHLNLRYHAEQCAFLDSALPDLQGKRVLELGCGTGRFSHELARRGAQVTGIDFSPLTLEVARKNALEPSIQFVQGSIFEPPVTGPFDVAVSVATITLACRNTREVHTTLRALHQRLAPDGQALFLEPLHNGPLRRTLRMSGRDFIATLESTGFICHRAEPLHFWPTRVLLSYIRWNGALTNWGASFGEACLARFRHPSLGDYHGILATSRPDAERSS